MFAQNGNEVGAQCNTSSNIESEFRAKIEEFSSKNKTISSKFTQTKKILNIKNSIVTKGDFYYTNNGSLSLIYSEPKGDKIVMQGENFSITTAGKTISSKASNNPVLSQIAIMMQGCMSGDLSNFNKGWELIITQNSGEYIVDLLPTSRRIKKYILSINMRFNAADMTLNQLKINEASGGYTSYCFTDKMLNL